MNFFNKETLENEGIALAEKAAGKVFDRLVASGQSQSGVGVAVTGDLVSVIVQAITSHISQGGTAPDVTLLKTSIGQLIEGTVGVLTATGKLSPAQAAKAEVVAQAVQGALLQGSGVTTQGTAATNALPSLKPAVGIGS